MSIRTVRRSRFSRVSACRYEPTEHSATRPIHRSPGARIQDYAVRKLVGIAPFSLLFNKIGKKGALLSRVIFTVRSSLWMTSARSLCVAHLLTSRRSLAPRVKAYEPPCQDLVTQHFI